MGSEHSDRHQALAEVIYRALREQGYNGKGVAEDNADGTAFVQEIDEGDEDVSSVTIDGYIDLYPIADAILKAGYLEPK